MTLEPQTLDELAQLEEPLKIADRCDRCGAQAFVRATFLNGELLFCAHHFAEKEEAICAQSVHIYDERAKINAKPSVSVNTD